jgi:uncharacterized small protein (TIGR04563 family)
MGERFGRGAREDGNVGTGGSKADSRKQSLYFREEVLQVLKEEAARLDRSLSWVVSRCITMSIDQIRALPAMSDVGESTDKE